MSAPTAADVLSSGPASQVNPKAEFGWTLRYPSWRQGFAAAYGPREPVRAAA